MDAGAGRRARHRPTGADSTVPGLQASDATSEPAVHLAGLPSAASTFIASCHPMSQTLSELRRRWYASSPPPRGPTRRCGRFTTGPPPDGCSLRSELSNGASGTCREFDQGARATLKPWGRPGAHQGVHLHLVPGVVGVEGRRGGGGAGTAVSGGGGSQSEHAICRPGSQSPQSNTPRSFSPYTCNPPRPLSKLGSPLSSLVLRLSRGPLVVRSRMDGPGDSAASVGVSNPRDQSARAQLRPGPWDKVAGKHSQQRGTARVPLACARCSRKVWARIRRVRGGIELSFWCSFWRGFLFIKVGGTSAMHSIGRVSTARRISTKPTK